MAETHDAARQSAAMRVSLVFGLSPRQRLEQEIELAWPSTVGQAIQASGWLQSMADLAEQLESGVLVCGVWGQKVAPSQLLKDGDRVEIYRALKVDPKEARRLRFAKQGARTAGLFAKRRPGSKPGY